jgi:type IV conjugative transfer system protein TraL
MAEYSPVFPQYMSAPTQVLWWEVDQLVIAALSFTAALLQGGVLTWILFVVIQISYARIKRNRPRGFLQHITYMFGLSKLNDYPEYFQQEFNE